DDHPAIRAGVKGELEKSDDIEVVGEASSGEEALRMVAELAPDLMLLDMVLPDLDGIDVARQLRKTHPQVRILVFSGYADDAFVFGVLGAGAVGYLLKDEAPGRLANAVRTAMQGHVFLSDSVAQKVIRRTMGERPQLTIRELDVLARLAEGKSTNQIAMELDISTKTVGNHASNMLNKFNLTSRAELVAHAMREGWVHPSKR
ncbi:MAG: response regulator transcription factor, partial [Chloroflexi bacterium]|nr:response regulator transcription factor [Chloroflexota bacterium]